MRDRRTALLVRCSEEEAKAIRESARRERRTISGFILNAVLNRITHQKQLEQTWRKRQPVERRANNETLT